jgi:uncharacterized phage-like protein YoqJ
MIAAATGHRPDKLGTDAYSGYIEDNPLRIWVKGRMRDYLRRAKPLYAISGMAIGVDQDFAEVCIELRVPFVAAVPFIGQERRWRPDAQEKYRALLAKAHEVVVVSDGPYERWKMIARNQWMVDHCNEVCAVFDGTPGGTASTVLYAVQVHRPIYRIDPNEFRALLAAGAAS